MDVANGEFLEEIEDVPSLSRSATPPDEPYAPDGSSSLTPQVTNPSEDAVPRNVSATSNREEISSEQVMAS